MTTKFPLLAECEPARDAAADRPASSPVYRVAFAKDGPPCLDSICTLYELFKSSVEKWSDRPCLGHRKIVNGTADSYEFITYKETEEKVALCGAGYMKLGLTPRDRVGVFGANNPEWMISMQGCNRMNLCCVPLYETLGEDAVEYVVNHAEVKLIVAQACKLTSLQKIIPRLTTSIIAVVYWGAAQETSLQGFGDVRVISFNDFLSEGAASPVPPIPPASEDLCTLMYTSGTTGDPKGVMLTHRAIVSTIASLSAFLDDAKLHLDYTEVMLSYLPLAHIFDRLGEELILHCGGCIGYWRGDIKGLVDDISALKPTFFVGVPRVFDRIYTGIQDQINQSSTLKKAIFHLFYNRKKHRLARGAAQHVAAPMADRVVFNKIKQRLGGRVKVVCTGAAPLAPHVEEFLKVAMCAPVVQGYGLTETCAASFVQKPNDWHQTGTVGPPMPVTDFRLEAVPDMNYSPLTFPPRGEICIRGPGLFSGYYKNEEQSRQDMDADGFFHTGDIGELTPDGALKIIDRKKNIFKLAQGEYVAVEKLENVYKQCPLVEQIWVYGNSFESQLVAVVVPKEEAIKAIGQKLGQEGEMQALLSRPAVKAEVLKELTATGKAQKLKGFEAVKAVHLDKEHWTPHNDLLTPTFKLKRAQLLKHYQHDVDQMYVELKLQAGN